MDISFWEIWVFGYKKKIFNLKNKSKNIITPQKVFKLNLIKFVHVDFQALKQISQNLFEFSKKNIYLYYL